MNFLSTRRTLPCFVFLLCLPLLATDLAWAECNIESTFDPRATAPIVVDLELLCQGTTASGVIWSLGDGTYINGNPISHTYIADGAVLVTASRLAASLPTETTLHLPGFLLLDDFESAIDSVGYWGLEGQPQIDRFMQALNIEADGNTEFEFTIYGSGDIGPIGSPDGGGSYGSSGLQLPPVGPGTAPKNPDDGPLNQATSNQSSSGAAAGYAEGQVVFDLRWQMDWPHIATANAPLQFEVLELAGPGVSLMARLDAGEMFIRLETATANTAWMSLGSGDLDTRLAVKMANRNGRRTTVAVEWRLQGQTTVHTVLMRLPDDNNELLGFVTSPLRAQAEDGSVAPEQELGAIYLDDFEYSNYSDGIHQSTF